MIARPLGHRSRCRSKNLRRNGAQAKMSMFNLYLLARIGANSMTSHSLESPVRLLQVPLILDFLIPPRDSCIG